MRRRQISWAVFLGALLAAPAAFAGDVNLALDRFDPAPADDKLFGLSSPMVDGDFRLDVRLSADYGHNPLVFNSGKTLKLVVENQAMASLGLSLSLWRFVNLSVDLPMAAFQSGESPKIGTATFPSPSGMHLGDFRLGARLHLFGDGLFQAGVGGYLWLPLGSDTSVDGAYVSDGRARGRLELLLGGISDRLLWAFAIGPDLRKPQTYLKITQGNMLRVSLGGGVRLLSERQLQIGPEVVGAVKLTDMGQYNTNAEALLGLKYRVAGVVAGLGAGMGFASGIGTPDFRAVASIGYGMELPSFKREPRPVEPEVKAEEKEAPVAVAQAEPAKAEPAVEEKPAAETRPVEPAPVVAEKPAVEEKPAEAIAVAPTPVEKPVETPAATPAPAVEEKPVRPIEAVAKAPVVEEKPKKIEEMGGAPKFAVVSFLKESARLGKYDEVALRAVRDWLKAHPNARLRIEGHTDSKGDEGYNSTLSVRRAKVVANWLIANGIEASRLKAEGFGFSRPVGDNETDEGRRQNRRVEFIVEE